MKHEKCKQVRRRRGDHVSYRPVPIRTRSISNAPSATGVWYKELDGPIYPI